MQIQSVSDIPPIPAQEAAILAAQLIDRLESAGKQSGSTVLTRLSRGDFELEGVHYAFTKEITPEGATFNMTAAIGYLPFTAEAKEKRAALMQILRAAPRLKRARFIVDRHGHIALYSATTLKADADDADAIMAVMAFYQESSPLLRLIAKYL
jgi:hypothetical protein